MEEFTSHAPDKPAQTTKEVERKVIALKRPSGLGQETASTATGQAE